MVKLLSIFKPNVVVICYGLYSTINASMVWGGVFGLFPPTEQTADFLARTFSSQTVCFIISSFVFVGVTYYHARLPRRFMVVSATLAFLCAILVVFLAFKGIIVYDLAALIAGACLGYESCAMSLFYVIMLTAVSIEEGTRNMLLSALYGAVFYLALSVLPHVGPGIVVPLIILPTVCIAMLFQVRATDAQSPLFAEQPSSQAGIYKKAFKGYWRTTLCFGALAICAGIMRAFNVTPPETGNLVNIFSMAGMLVITLALVFATAKRSFRFDTLLFYRRCFPLLITGFLLLPIFRVDMPLPFSIFVSTVFNVCTVFMMIQCVQAAHNQGINPALLYGTIAGFAFAVHNLGYFGGSYVAATVETIGLQLLFISIVAVYALGFMFFLGEGGFHRRITNSLNPEAIELFIQNQQQGRTRRFDDELKKEGPDSRPHGERKGFDGSAASHATFRERLEAFKERYRLSVREAEIVDLLLHGDSAAQIAEELFISENTVRTHIRRIYAKVGVNKKQDMLNTFKEF